MNRKLLHEVDVGLASEWLGLLGLGQGQGQGLGQGLGQGQGLGVSQRKLESSTSGSSSGSSSTSSSSSGSSSGILNATQAMLVCEGLAALAKSFEFCDADGAGAAAAAAAAAGIGTAGTGAGAGTAGSRIGTTVAGGAGGAVGAVGVSVMGTKLESLLPYAAAFLKGVEEVSPSGVPCLTLGSGSGSGQGQEQGQGQGQGHRRNQHQQQHQPPPSSSSSSSSSSYLHPSGPYANNASKNTLPLIRRCYYLPPGQQGGAVLGVGLVSLVKQLSECAWVPCSVEGGGEAGVGAGAGVGVGAGVVGSIIVLRPCECLLTPPPSTLPSASGSGFSSAMPIAKLPPSLRSALSTLLPAAFHTALRYGFMHPIQSNPIQLL